MNRQKGISTTLSILLIALLVVVVGGAVAYNYYLTPEEELSVGEIPGEAQDETADWKTYRDEEHRFEFKYPEKISYDGHLSMPTFNVEPRVIPIECEYANFSEGCPYLKLEGVKGGPKFKKEESTKLKELEIDTEQLTINHIPFCFWMYTKSAMGGQRYDIYHYATANKDGKCFAVYFVISAFRDRKIIDDMISTFRFLE